MRIPLRDSLSYQQSKLAVIVAFTIGIFLSTIQIALDYSAERAELNESIANIIATANRSAFHAAYNLDETGARQELELHGFPATVVQHEFDHLDGKLYIDRIKDSRLLAFSEELERHQNSWESLITSL